jgi:hypothetical protein
VRVASGEMEGGILGVFWRRVGARGLGCGGVALE